MSGPFHNEFGLFPSKGMLIRGVSQEILRYRYSVRRLSEHAAVGSWQQTAGIKHLVILKALSITYLSIPSAENYRIEYLFNWAN